MWISGEPGGSCDIGLDCHEGDEHGYDTRNIGGGENEITYLCCCKQDNDVVYDCVFVHYAWEY